jgi:CubicO group peptidase (beta-lactamase class C family)
MNVEAINQLLQSGIQQGDFPGVSYAVVRNDGSIIEHQLGYKQLIPTRIPVEPNTIYDCASLTKVISTTTMIFKCIEEGLVDLTTTIASILPKFKHTQITIEDCLIHSSGLPADIPRAKSLRNKTDVLDKIYAMDLQYPTGSKIIYSDIGFILLGLVIEQVTNKSIHEYSHKVVFAPLEMKHTSYHPNPSKCAPTEFREDGVYNGLLQGKVHDEKAFALGGEAGHAGMFSTVHDLSKFMLSILRNDELVLSKTTVDNLFPLRKEFEVEPDRIRKRAYGWDKPTKGGTAGDYVSFENTILHTGFTGCNIWIERDKGIGFVMLSNAVHPKREKNNIIKYRHKISNIILSSLEDQQ